MADLIFSKVDEYREICSSVASCKNRIAQTDSQMLEVLGKEKGEMEGGYRWNADKIKVFVITKNQVSYNILLYITTSS